MNPFLHGAALPVPVLNIGHRGCAAAPENTIAAFSFAFAAGADAVECDLRTSADGIIVVMHDETVDRTCGNRGGQTVLSMSFPEIKALDAGAGQGSVPTLQEALAFVRSHNKFITLEIKHALPDEVIRIVDETQMAERVILSSFDLNFCLEARKLRPDIAVSALLEKPDDNFPKYARQTLGADLVGPSKEAATPGFIAAATRLGLGVHVWTVDDPAQMKALVAAGVTGIFTDRPEKLARVLAHP